MPPSQVYFPQIFKPARTGHDAQSNLLLDPQEKIERQPTRLTIETSRERKNGFFNEWFPKAIYQGQRAISWEICLSTHYLSKEQTKPSHGTRAWFSRNQCLLNFQEITDLGQDRTCNHKHKSNLITHYREKSGLGQNYVKKIPKKLTVCPINNIDCVNGI